MREVQASDVGLQLPGLLDDIARGETIIITQQGAPIARLVPEASLAKPSRIDVFAEIEKFRKTMPRISLEDLISSRHEDHKY